jgi:hypothetical protein
MYVNKHVGACLSLLAAILLLVGVAIVVRISQPGEVQAQTVQGYSLITLYDGGDAYTSTQYSNPLLGGYFSHVQVQMATTAATSTHTLSVTPQFSNEAVACSAITDWFDGALVEVYADYASTATADLYAEAGTTETVTSTTTLATSSNGLALGSVSMLTRLSGAAPSAVGRDFPVLGQCIRFKLESSGSDDVYTPTLYARLIND